jgi:hypothetical protein
MRSLPLLLYSQPKRPRFQTSAQPSPPVVFVAPSSKAYHSPFGSASVGVSSPRTSQRSRKCECAAARSVRSAERHSAMKSEACMASVVSYAGLINQPRMHGHLRNPDARPAASAGFARFAIRPPIKSPNWHRILVLMATSERPQMGSHSWEHSSTIRRSFAVDLLQIQPGPLLDTISGCGSRQLGGAPAESPRAPKEWRVALRSTRPTKLCGTAAGLV